MAKTKEQKNKIIEKLKTNMQKQKIIVFADFSNVKSKDLFKLKNTLKKQGNILTIAKKTLINISLKDIKATGTDVMKMKGQLAMAMGFKDEISMAKAMWQFSKENKDFKILGGIFENNFMGKERFEELAQLPSKEELLTKLVGSIAAPIKNFAYALQYNIKGLMYILSSIKK